MFPGSGLFRLEVPAVVPQGGGGASWPPLPPARLQQHGVQQEDDPQRPPL